MSKSLIVSLVIGGLVIFVLGGGIGVFYQTQQAQQNVPQNNENKVALASTLIKTLTSKVIPAITAFGEVTKIDGKNITLKSEGDSLTMIIDDNAQIYSFTTASPSGKSTVAVPIQTKIEFKDIKIGDNLNISAKLLPNGTLKGMSVVIINLVTNTNINTK